MMISFGRLSYDNLSDLEWIALKHYLDENDQKILSNIILSQKELSPDMRRFIVDHIAGRVSRPAGKKTSVKTRNSAIVKGIFYLLKIRHKLTSGAHGDGSAQIMAKRFNVTEDVALDAYKKLKHQKADIMQPGLEDVTYYNDLPSPPPIRLTPDYRKALAKSEKAILDMLNSIRETKSSILGKASPKASKCKNLSFEAIEALEAQMREELRDLLQLARERAKKKMENEITHIP
ncbi:hypothetical protein [Methylomonas sp. HYX-M1]|uniref:hypothetical protein n=1 Tax=Methylomonas sp. HYX-M1 TaxID=3139307 RepID=UPI00345C50BA